MRLRTLNDLADLYMRCRECVDVQQQRTIDSVISEMTAIVRARSPHATYFTIPRGQSLLVYRFTYERYIEQQWDLTWNMQWYGGSRDRALFAHFHDMEPYRTAPSNPMEQLAWYASFERLWSAWCRTWKKRVGLVSTDDHIIHRFHAAICRGDCLRRRYAIVRERLHAALLDQLHALGAIKSQYRTHTAYCSGASNNNQLFVITVGDYVLRLQCGRLLQEDPTVEIDLRAPVVVPAFPIRQRLYLHKGRSYNSKNGPALPSVGPTAMDSVRALIGLPPLVKEGEDYGDQEDPRRDDAR